MASHYGKVHDADDTGSDDTRQNHIVPALARLDLADQLSNSRQLIRHIVDPAIDILKGCALTVQIVLGSICLSNNLKYQGVCVVRTSTIAYCLKLMVAQATNTNITPR